VGPERLTSNPVRRKVNASGLRSERGPGLHINLLFSSLRVVAVFWGVTLLIDPHLLQAQQLPSNTIDAWTGQVVVRVQEGAGLQFGGPATVTLRSSDMLTNLTTSTSSDTGQALFPALPAGTYLVEISAPGYRTVREQTIIAANREVENILVVMVPDTGNATSRTVAVPPNALKETEKGLHALQIGKLDEAQQHLKRALDLAPNFADGNYLMGVLYLRRNDSAQARGYLQKAVDLAPSNAAALLALGNAEYLQLDYSRASASLEQFLHEQPNNPQAAKARQLIERMRGLNQPKVKGVATATKSSDGDVAELKLPNNVNKPALADLPALPVITPVTETNWSPPDVDDEKLILESGANCQLDQVTRAAGARVQELVQNVDRFTATEELEHTSLSPLGLQLSRETRKFNYLVEIRQLNSNDLDVQEYRNGSVSVQQFPAHIGTIGLPTLVLVFHPYYQEKYEFACEGRGAWRSKPAWVVHFRQRTDRNSQMLVYRVGGKFISVGLKGRAWIDTESSQIVAMEADIMRPVPEIRLFRDHQLIEYGPVDFRNNTMRLWLPKSADWYCSLSGQRYHRRHTFSQFLLFSVDDSQKISKPKETVEQAAPKP
jgi:tetratricopeptide (TPR) repeat protein